VCCHLLESEGNNGAGDGDEVGVEGEGRGEKGGG